MLMLLQVLMLHCMVKHALHCMGMHATSRSLPVPSAGNGLRRSGLGVTGTTPTSRCDGMIGNMSGLCCLHGSSGLCHLSHFFLSPPVLCHPGHMHLHPRDSRLQVRRLMKLQLQVGSRGRGEIHLADRRCTGILNKLIIRHGSCNLVFEGADEPLLHLTFA